MNLIKSIDIFCAVVDNFGDIGVCWRLSRQLSLDHHITVRLFVDDMESAKAIMPDDRSGVEVIHWVKDIDYHQAADMVIEAFACPLPDNVIAAMVAKKSVWIDLEYISAEDWVAGCHAIPSKHPSTGLTKTLFFPGFDAQTGGIIRENGLISRRNAFLNDENAHNLWRKAHFIPEIDQKYIDISLFCYKTAPLDQLIEHLGGADKPIRLFRPVRTPQNTPQKVGSVEIIEIPFLSQVDYDYLLWTCDFNFVRGEDSFVRAQLAGKPFIWNIYVQEEAAHLVKLHAFLEKIRPFYDEASFERLANLHDLWNEEGQILTKHSWDVCGLSLQSLAGLKSGAQNWSDYLCNQIDLSTQLLTFANTQITKK
ncbi:MAG: hypothetical protein A3B66_03115 [Alphaproteobacteria bacterium RIFCSPHIGHO2_02_FULL_46_13]|nr:MAG: hypothetical protein A3B66_03115 [Alphaproteobacteria bacterium RIFCSPHIGHO2_02_FULL_46_13]